MLFTSLWNEHLFPARLKLLASGHCLSYKKEGVETISLSDVTCPRFAAMWIQVRTMDGKDTHRVDSLSKLTKVDELRVKITELFNVEPDRQRLFYRGKQVTCAIRKPFYFHYVTNLLKSVIFSQ